MLRTAVVDVIPPRASKWAKRSRRWFGQPRSVLATLSATALEACGDWNYAGSVSQTAWQVLIPGLPQILGGHQIRGRVFLAVYSVLLFCGLFLVGSFLGDALLGLALATHLASILDVVVAGAAGRGAVLAYGVLLLAITVCAIYLPANWLTARVATPLVIRADSGPFRAGDAILYSPSAYVRRAPAAGEVVYYSLPGATLDLRSGAYRYGVYRYRAEGARIDRVIAVPGQHFLCSEGKIAVDGQMPARGPLGDGPLPHKWELTVPVDHVLIMPSQDRVPADSGQQIWQQMSLIPRSRVLGRTYLWRGTDAWIWKRLL